MDTAALLIVAGLALVALVAGAVLRLVPAGHRGVVIRGGRVLRTRPPGVLVRVPAVERVEMVPIYVQAIDPLNVSGQTREGVEVRLTVSVLWQLRDPELAARAQRDPRSATEDGVERALRHLIAEMGVATLLRDREAVVARSMVSALPFMGSVGVELVDVALVDAEVRVGPELLRLLA